MENSDLLQASGNECGNIKANIGLPEIRGGYYWGRGAANDCNYYHYQLDNDGEQFACRNIGRPRLFSDNEYPCRNTASNFTSKYKKIYMPPPLQREAYIQMLEDAADEKRERKRGKMEGEKDVQHGIDVTANILFNKLKEKGLYPSCENSKMLSNLLYLVYLAGYQPENVGSSLVEDLNKKLDHIVNDIWTSRELTETPVGYTQSDAELAPIPVYVDSDEGLNYEFNYPDSDDGSVVDPRPDEDPVGVLDDRTKAFYLTRSLIDNYIIKLCEPRVSLWSDDDVHGFALAAADAEAEEAAAAAAADTFAGDRRKGRGGSKHKSSRKRKHKSRRKRKNQSKRKHNSRRKRKHRS